MPELLPLVICAYSTPLFFGKDIIPSWESCGWSSRSIALLLCYSWLDATIAKRAYTNVFYLDDCMLGGIAWRRSSKTSTPWNQWQGKLGLQPNCGKSELICDESATRKAMLLAVPGLSVVDRHHATLLGSPIGTANNIQDPWQVKVTRDLVEQARLLCACSTWVYSLLSSCLEWFWMSISLTQHGPKHLFQSKLAV